MSSRATARPQPPLTPGAGHVAAPLLWLVPDRRLVPEPGGSR